MKKIFFLLVAAIVSECVIRAQNIQEIVISSSRHGWGSEDKSMTITRKNGGYFNGKRMIPVKRVVALEASLNSPVIEKLDLDSLGITQKWLDANAEPALNEVMRGEWSKPEKELFLSTFKDRAKFNEALQDRYQGGWTDDYPRVDISIRMADGRSISLSSTVQQSFMIPWDVTRGENKSRNYNADISRSLAALLPEKFPNKTRISGAGLRDKVAELIKFRLNEPLGLLRTEAQIGAQLKPVKERFEIIKSSINAMISIDVEPDIKHNLYSTWNANLKRKGMTPQLQIGVNLPYDGHQALGLELFLKNIGPYIALTESVPWLARFLAAHPETRLDIRYVNDRSLSERALKSFLEDMNQLGKSGLAEQIQQSGARAAFLEILTAPGEWSRWIILPDRRMILWRIEKNLALNWKITDFNSTKARGPIPVGALISEQGEIIHDSGN